MRMLAALNSFSTWRGYTSKENTVKGYDRSIRWFCLYLGNPEVGDITFERVLGYLSDLKAYGWDENTLIPVGMAVRKFFQFLDMQKLSNVNPAMVPIPPKTYRIPRIATRELFEKLISVRPRDQNQSRCVRNNAIIRMLWETGVRVTELCMLNVADLDLIKNSAVIRTEKSQGRRPFRVICWSEDTKRALELYLEDRENLMRRVDFDEPDALFISIANQHNGRRITKNGINCMLQKYCNDAKMPYMSSHAFRHGKARKILDDDGDISDVANILGHSSINSSMPYLALAGDRLVRRAQQFLG